MSNNATATISIREVHEYKHRFALVPTQMANGTWIWLKQFRQVKRDVECWAYYQNYMDNHSRFTINMYLSKEDFLVHQLAGRVDPKRRIWEYEIDDTEESIEEWENTF